MRRRMIVLGGALLVGCIGVRREPTRTEQEAVARAEYAAANKERDEYRAKRDAESRRKAEEKAARLDADEAQRTQAREQRTADAKSERAAQAVSDCADDLPQRAAEMQKRMDSVARVDELRDWEAAHCRSEDNSVEVTRVGQDSRGRYHAVAGRSRGVDRVCNAKKPKEIETISARDLRVYQIPMDVSEKNSRCKDADIKASETAARYWEK